jgi:aryl-alcohol dehydrogenase-like predicted oxidoreductase
VKYNRLGRTGLYVSEICLGAMTFGQAGDVPLWQAIGDVAASEAHRIIERALAAGVNFIDTADVYADGDSERIVGRSLKALGVPRKEVVLATKVSLPTGPKPNDAGASRGHILDAVHGSLERLQTDHIDLYQIHANDAVTPI